MTKRASATAEQTGLFATADQMPETKATPAQKKKAEAKPAPKVEAAPKPKVTPTPKQEVAVAPERSRAVATAGKPEDLISSLLRSITDHRVDPAKLTVMLDARDRLMREQAQNQFMTAYIAMQAKLPSIDRDGKLDQGTTKSGRQGVSARYATFDNINATVRPILVEHKMGMLLLPDAAETGGGIIVRGQLGFVCDTPYGQITHIERCTIPVPSDPTGGKSPPQGIGSALSYGKRYGAIALLNLVTHAPEDTDDSAKAAGRRRPAVEEVPPSISAAQLKELEAAIKDCGVDVSVFCGKYNIETVAALPSTLFAAAIAACTEFKKKMGT